MALRLNIKAVTEEFINKFQINLIEALNAWEVDFKKYNNSFYTFYSEKSEVDFDIQRETNIVVAYLKANPYALASSYGTGSLMLDDNPGLAEYKRKYWNPARKGKTIVGRPAGKYKTMFGNERTSSGKFEGQNIEGKMVYRGKRFHKDGLDGEDYYIYPSPPTKAIQIAEEFFYKQWLPKVYSKTVEQMNFSNFLIES